MKLVMKVWSLSLVVLLVSCATAGPSTSVVTEPANQPVEGNAALSPVQPEATAPEQVVVETPVVVLPPPQPSVLLEQKARTLREAGLAFEALDTYLDASLLALATEQDGSDRFSVLTESFLKLAQELRLSNARPEVLYSTMTGKPFEQPFQVRFVDAAGKPVAGAPIRFLFKSKKSGRLAATGLTVVTDNDGLAGFAFPVPDFSGSDEVSFVLDVNAWLEKLVNAESPNTPGVTDGVARQIEALSLASKGSIRYSIDSLSKSIPMSLVFADYDQTGALMKREVQAGLLTGLAKSGFSVTPYAMNLALLKAKDDSTVLLAWLSQGKKSGRAVFGTSQVAEVTTADKKTTASVTGTLKVYDLETRKLVHVAKAGKAATAGDRATAITLAQQLLAKAFIDELTEELP